MKTRKRVKKLLAWGFFVMGLVVFYLVLDALLAAREAIFDWCTIEQPDEVIPGEDVMIRIHYHDLDEPLKLAALLRRCTYDGAYKRAVMSRPWLPELRGSATCELSFELPRDKDVHSVKLHAYLTRADTKAGRVGQVLQGPPIFVSERFRDRLPSRSLADNLKTAWKAFTSVQWIQRISESTAMEWVITAVYLVAFLITLLCAWQTRSRFERESQYHWLWWGLAAALLLLAINKQLELHSLLTQIGRDLARANHWYIERQSFQRRFVLLLITTGIAFLAILGYWIRSVWKRCWLAICGVSLLAVFILVRAASFHHFNRLNRLLGIEIGGIRLWMPFELGGLVLIAVSALQNILHSRGRH